MKSGARRGGGPQGAPLVVLQSRGRLREKLSDPLDARQFLPFRRNLLVLSFSRLHLVDLADLEFEQLERSDAVLRRLVEAREVALGAEELAKERGPLRRFLPEAREPVEELARRVGVEEVSRLRLPVEHEEARRDLLQGLQGRRRAVHEEPALAARRDLAPHDDLERARAAFLEEARLDERAPRLGVVAVERALDDEPLGPRPHERGIRPPSREQHHGVHDERLAGARLSRQDGEAFPERHLDVLEDREVADAERGQHGSRPQRHASLLPLQPVSQPAQREAQPEGRRPDGIAGVVAVVIGRARDVEVRPRRLRVHELLEEHRAVDRAAPPAARVLHVRPVGADVLAVLLPHREAPEALVRPLPRLHELLREGVVVREHDRRLEPERHESRARERRVVQDDRGLPFGRVVERVREDDAALGVRVVDLGRLAVAESHDVARLVRGARGQVLGERRDPDEVDVEAKVRGGQDGAHRRGRAHHVPLHVAHLVGGLDRDPAGIERDALSDERHGSRRPSGRPGTRGRRRAAPRRRRGSPRGDRPSFPSGSPSCRGPSPSRRGPSLPFERGPRSRAGACRSTACCRGRARGGPRARRRARPRLHGPRRPGTRRGAATAIAASGVFSASADL